MTGDRIPTLLYGDIAEAVDTAILFGVSATDFKRLVAEHWDAVLAQKRKRDAEEFSK